MESFVRITTAVQTAREKFVLETHR